MRKDEEPLLIKKILYMSLSEFNVTLESLRTLFYYEILEEVKRSSRRGSFAMRSLVFQEVLSIPSKVT